MTNKKEPKMTDAELNINIDPWGTDRDGRVSLVYDPEAHAVYAECHHGSGTSPQIWYGLHKVVARFKTDVTPDSVISFAAYRADDFAALRAEYRGQDWDGHNHVGQWSDRAVDIAQAMGEEFADAQRSGEVTSYWTADQYYSQMSKTELRGIVLDAGGVDKATADEIAGAGHEFALEYDDVHAYLTAACEIGDEEQHGHTV